MSLRHNTRSSRGFDDRLRAAMAQASESTTRRTGLLLHAATLLCKLPGSACTICLAWSPWCRISRPRVGIAISESFYRNRAMFPLFRDPCDPRSIYFPGEIPLGAFSWLEKHKPVAIAGTSIRLYHVQ
jgi:hypothetical protein